MRNYFNHAGVGPISKSARKAMAQYLTDYSRLGPNAAILKYRHDVSKMYAQAARLINCSEDEIVYIKNTTEGIIIAAESLPLEIGDEIILLDNEYSANCIPWLKKQKDGMPIRFVEGASNEERYDNLRHCITSATKVIAVSWVHYYDGFMANLQELSAICAERNIFLVVDAIQGMGTRKIDVAELKIDFLLCGGHKHLGSVMGSGFMYVNKKILGQLNDFKVGTRSVEKFHRGGYELRKSAKRFEDGTPSLIAVISLYHALLDVNSLGIELIEEKNLKLLAKLKSMLAESGIGFIDNARQGNIISLKVAEQDGLIAYFQEQDVSVKKIKDIVRISFSHKTSARAMQHLMKCLHGAKKMKLI
jgi:cysteine desulfurase/selenocysteine lyase